MRNHLSWAKYVVLVMSIFGIPSVSIGQVGCVTKCGDFEECSGFSYSVRCRVCSFCSNPPSCYCGASAQTESYLDTLHPGVLLRKVDGRSVIAKVLRGSPALSAGLRRGDEILKVNGRNLPEVSCENQKWASSTDPLLSALTIRRGTAEMTVSVRLVPLRLLAENAWQTSLESVRQPILKSQSIGQRLATFTVGIRANRYHSRVAIAAVLEGSSAKHAGLHLGDEIVMLNGIRTSDMTDQAIAETLEREDGMAMLTLRRGEMEWNATLLVEGLAQVLNRADVTDGPQIDNTKMARAE